MTDKSFVQLVHQSFDYLVAEFNFRVDGQHQSNDQDDSGFVEYRSSTTVVRAEKVGRNLLVSIMPAGEPEVSREYLPMIAEAIKGSTDSNWPVIVAPAQYEASLVLYATALRRDFKHLLLGDFTEWLGILRHRIADRRRDYYSWTGKQLPATTFRELDEYIEAKAAQGHYP